MARYCVGSVDSSTAVLGSAVHYSPVRYSETVLTSVGTRRRRRRSTHAHNTSAHTTVPPPHTRPMSRHECIPDPPVPGREPAHSARAEDVSPIRRSGPGTAPPEPCPATGHPSSPAAAQIGPPRSSHRPEQRRQRDVMCPGTNGSRTRAARGRAGRPGARPPAKGKPDFLLLWPAHYCNFHTEFLRYNSSAVMRCKHL